MFAALFIAAAVLVSCQKEEILDVDNGAILKSVEASSGCNDCLDADEPEYVQKTITMDYTAGPQGSVTVVIYNTPTQLVYSFTSIPSDIHKIDIGGVTYFNSSSPQAPATEPFVVPIDLVAKYGENWGCTLVNDLIEVRRTPGDNGTGPGMYISAQTNYTLIPVCKDDPEEVCDWALKSTESAWAAGSRYVTRGNWATYTKYVSGATVTLFAGQTISVGTAQFSPVVNGEVTITVQLNAGANTKWEFSDVMESLKVQHYSTAPSGNPAPGLFAWKQNATGSSAIITVPASNFYGVHLDVSKWEWECK